MTSRQIIRVNLTRHHACPPSHLVIAPKAQQKVALVVRLLGTCSVVKVAWASVKGVSNFLPICGNTTSHSCGLNHGVPPRLRTQFLKNIKMLFASLKYSVFIWNLSEKKLYLRCYSLQNENEGGSIQPLKTFKTITCGKWVQAHKPIEQLLLWKLKKSCSNWSASIQASLSFFRLFAKCSSR